MDGAALSGWLLFVGLVQLVPPEVPPPLPADVDLFPSAEIVCQRRQQNHDHRRWLLALAEAEPSRHELWEALAEEADRWDDAHYYLYRAQMTRCPHDRVHWLSRYRDRVGWTHYYAGHLPPAVPPWHPHRPGQ